MEQISNNCDRGEVVELLFITKYPNGDIRVGRLDTKNVHSVLISEEAVLDHLGKSETALAQWNTGKWEDNPSVLVRSTLNGIDKCGFYCQHAGHDLAQAVGNLLAVDHGTSA